MIELLKIIPSTNKNKKFTAYFLKDGKEIITHFGQKGFSDYTIHKDKKRRKLYLQRHKVDLNTNNPVKAGYLSIFLLWGRTPSLGGNINIYKALLNRYNKSKNIKVFYDEFDKLLKDS